MWKKRLAAGLAAVMTVGCAWAGELECGAEEEIPEVTIWVDEDSQCVIREALAGYQAARENAGTRYEAYFPPVSWKLIDKSDLTAGQLQAALLEELDAGGGPDLIVLDGANGWDPKELMESGYLMELTGMTEKYVQEKLSYPPEVLEVGQLEGKQYLIPVTMRCPVVFGETEALARAGIDTESGYGDLAEFLAALVEASKASGKLIFDSGEAVDWMEQYCLPEEEAADGKVTEEGADLKELLEETRKRSGGTGGFFGPYEAIRSGEALLSGCGLTSKSKLAQNLSLLSDREISFLNVPSWDGEIRAVVTRGVAVNKNTPYPEAAKALIQAFQGPYPNDSQATEDFPAAGTRTYWKNQISKQAALAQEALEGHYAELARNISTTDNISKEFREHALNALTGAVYQRTAEEPEQDAALPTEKAEVLTVLYENLGMGEEHPLFSWLDSAAAEFSNEEVRMRLIPFSSGAFGAISAAYFMEEAGVGPDIILSAAYTQAGSEDFFKWYMELSDFLADCQEDVEGAAAGDEIRGLVWGRDEEKDKRYAFFVSKKSSMRETALSFCVQALKNENYQAAVEAMGLTAGTLRK